jgi:hypothetical protein
VFWIISLPTSLLFSLDRKIYRNIFSAQYLFPLRFRDGAWTFSPFLTWKTSSFCFSESESMKTEISQLKYILGIFPQLFCFTRTFFFSISFSFVCVHFLDNLMKNENLELFMDLLLLNASERRRWCFTSLLFRCCAKLSGRFCYVRAMKL